MFSGLIGVTGFVGGALARQRQFDFKYHSKNINDISGRSFDLVVCAGAPATMWEANKRPEADAANLDFLFEALQSARIGRLVLISTIAVFDDMAAGYTESTAQFERSKAYGRNRRDLELRAMEAFDCHVIRLPALFGCGLKKNFIFDIMNPIPSFVTNERFLALGQRFDEEARELLVAAFHFDSELSMWRFDRQGFAATTPAGQRLERGFRQAGFVARSFTNSESRFQFYNIERLGRDIDTCVQASIRTLNICSEPLRAADIHMELLGETFENTTPPRVAEDIRSEFAEEFGGRSPYLFDKEVTLRELKSFVHSPVPK